MKTSIEIRAVKALRAYFAHMSREGMGGGGDRLPQNQGVRRAECRGRSQEGGGDMVKYGNRRRLEKAVDVLACVGVAVSFGFLFYVWVILMACM